MMNSNYFFRQDCFRNADFCSIRSRRDEGEMVILFRLDEETERVRIKFCDRTGDEEMQRSRKHGTERYSHDLDY